MKTRGGRFLLILGAALAVLAFVGVYIVMSKGISISGSTASVPTPVPLTPVAVISQDVPAYTVLDETNVGTVDFEPSSVPSNTVNVPSSLFGKMTTVAMRKGQPIQNNQITQATGFSNILDKGQRAFALAVPERSTFGDTISENDRVDVLWTALIQGDLKKGADGKLKDEKWVYTSTKTMLQDIKVLRVIKLSATVAPNSNQQANATNGAQAQPAASRSASYAPVDLYVDSAGYSTVLVLGVTDQQAEVLKFARENGIIDLTLRSSAMLKNPDGSLVKDAKGNEIKGDHDPETTTGITIDALIEKYGLPAPPQVKP